MDRFEQMRVFAAVVEAGSFIRASERVGMTRAAVSKHVLQLEDRLGARLLNRTTRHVAVTEVGQAYYETCRRLLEEVLEAERLVDSTRRGPRGELRVVAPTNFGLVQIGPAITTFLEAYPALRINLSLNDRPVDPIEASCDISIRVGASVPTLAGGLEACRLTRSVRILCASRDYLARAGEPAVPEDLRRHECLSYSYVEDPRVWRLRKDGRDHLVPVSGRIVTSAGQVLRTAAARGLGIAYGPRSFFDEDLRAGTVARVLGDYELPEVSVYSVFPSSRHPPAKTQAFNSFMREFFTDRFA